MLIITAVTAELTEQAHDWRTLAEQAGVDAVVRSIDDELPAAATACIVMAPQARLVAQIRFWLATLPVPVIVATSACRQAAVLCARCDPVRVIVHPQQLVYNIMDVLSLLSIIAEGMIMISPTDTIGRRP